MLDKAFYEEEVKRHCLAFEQQVYFLTVQNIIILSWKDIDWLNYKCFCIVYACFIHSLSHPNLSIFAVSLCCFLRVFEVKGAGDKKSYVDFRMCGSESKVESS